MHVGAVFQLVNVATARCIAAQNTTLALQACDVNNKVRCRMEHAVPSVACAPVGVAPGVLAEGPHHPSLPQAQHFNYTWLRLLQHGELCVVPVGAAGAPGLQPCEGWESSLAWRHSSMAARPELVSGIPTPPQLPSRLPGHSLCVQSRREAPWQGCAAPSAAW